VIIADDSGLYRDLLSHTLTSYGQSVVGEVGRADTLVDLVTSRACDVVLTDIRMPPTFSDDGLKACVQIRQRRPGVGIVLLSHHGEVDYAMRLLHDVPDRVGYLLKESATSALELLDTLERVVAGNVVMDPSLVARLMNQPRTDNPLDQLTQRERQVLALMAEGLGNVAIARAIHVTLSTVEKHATSVFRKLGIDVGESRENARVSAVLRYLRYTGRLPRTGAA
jgi:DNA-binding NarL/FixJ family response regulator